MSKNTDKWIGKRFDKLKVISCENTTPPNTLFTLIVNVTAEMK